MNLGFEGNLAGSIMKTPISPQPFAESPRPRAKAMHRRLGNEGCFGNRAQAAFPMRSTSRPVLAGRPRSHSGC